MITHNNFHSTFIVYTANKDACLILLVFTNSPVAYWRTVTMHMETFHSVGRNSVTQTQSINLALEINLPHHVMLHVKLSALEPRLKPLKSILKL